MELDEFETALDVHGPDIEEWPDHLRVPALELLDASSEARELLDDELRLAAAFAMQPKVKAPSSLADRIVFAAIASDAPAVELAPVMAKKPVEAGWSLKTVLEQALAAVAPWQFRYAFALSACFAIGVAGSQFLDGTEEYGSSLYVSSIYADLAY
ncbi:MAG: hypothetical protein EOP20_03405 [Hyphomicrobiales bacterium]|nr:MAG: hypothetical protein EOP20_03405 [Hyphomicrobiales bacterium]